MAAPKDSLELSSDLQEVSNQSYIAAAKRVGILIASSLGLNHFLNTTTIYPKWATFKVENKLYTLAVLSLMLTQYTIKTEELQGGLKNNQDRFSSIYAEEIEEVRRREERAAARRASPTPPAPPTQPIPTNLLPNTHLTHNADKLNV